jgi:TRAP-type mannitol/chloroaromatic compound transport system permease large subunit
MTFEIVWDSLMRTLKSTGTIIWVTIGAAALAAAYTLAGGPTYVANLIVGSDLPTMGVILLMMLIFLIMGMFMDWVGIVLLIMPVFLPIVLRLPVEEIGWFGQLDPRDVAIWFGVVFCMNMQVSFLSPPFGPAAFYLKSVAPPHISLTDIFKGFLPFIAIQILALSVLLIWPPIVTLFGVSLVVLDRADGADWRIRLCSLERLRRRGRDAPRACLRRCGALNEAPGLRCGAGAGRALRARIGG